MILLLLESNHPPFIRGKGGSWWCKLRVAGLVNVMVTTALTTHVGAWMIIPSRAHHGSRISLRRSASTTPDAVVTPPPLSLSSPSLSATSASTKSSVSKTPRKFLRRVRDSFLSKERSREELKIGIAGFYDRSSQLWENVWGEHMHHGYYIPEDRTDHQQAQIDLIDKVLEWGTVEKASRVVDVGCGIGGSSRHMARKYEGCTTEGITLSPYQANRGNELAIEQGLSDRCRFQVADALEMPFADNSFDLVWSLESGEHMPDKAIFVKELFRVAQPGGRILVVTWCHRDLQLGETKLQPWEENLLARINRAYYLPRWCSVQDYVNLFEQAGATDVTREDWSYVIAPFWKAVIQSSLNLKSLWGLLRSGFSTQRGAYAMILMLQGFRKGLIKFGLITCTKPRAINISSNVLSPSP